MNDLPKNDVLKNLKQQFLNGNLVEYDHKYEKTVASWEKSRAAGADAHAVRLGEDCRDLHVFDRIDHISKCHLAYFRDYYESRSTALERMGGAMFYLDTQLVAFHKSGSAALLKELKAKGLSERGFPLKMSAFLPETPRRKSPLLPASVQGRGTIAICSRHMPALPAMAKLRQAPDFTR